MIQFRETLESYLRKYSTTARANYAVFKNPGWNFPKPWVEFFLHIVPP